MLRWTAAALVALASLAATPAAQAQRLAARYELDGSGADSSGFAVDARPVGSPVGIPDGRFGSAFRFGDVDDGFVVDSSSLLQPPTISVAAWVRSPTPVGTVKTILSQGGAGNCSYSSYALYTGGSLDAAGVRFYIWNGTATAVSPPAPQTIWDGAWHMVAGTYDGQTVRLYVDGVQVGDGTPASGPIAYGLPGTNTFAIGNYAGKLFGNECIENTAFPRDIDQVMVFTSSLSAAEVAALPAVPTPPPTPTPTPVAPVPTPAPVLDSDGDGIPDSQDTLPAGNLPPVAGKRVQAAAASGELLVKLPGADGFVALKGVASLPVGSVVDARAGSLTVAAAANARGTSTGSAKVAAGIFKIRQDQAAATTDLLLQTPAGAARACAPGRKPPKKGVVRTLSVTTAKGVFRTVAAKGTIGGAKATWTVSDTCSGTLTAVRKGKVSVKAGKRTKTLKAGQRYLIKARLFAARQSG
ncbi:MAG TPA: LamG-like jellyroll fold domain-containing protein [Solirubrobacter sp.]